MDATPNNPEIAKRVHAGGISTNYHDQGSGHPLLMIHGSGPGVTAWANWRLNIGPLSSVARVIAPDMVGFGYTDAPVGTPYTLPTWVRQLIDLMDALGIAQADVVGNSFGGAVALALAVKHPERVRNLVLMGSVGIEFELTPGLDAVWGYTPSIENMKRLLDVFAFDRTLVTDELAELRYRASIRPGVQESFCRMFSPGPRQRFISALASRESDLRSLPHETLLLHGRDDQVIPVTNSIRLGQLIPMAQVHLFPNCGHWTQIEWTQVFNVMVSDFIVGRTRRASAGG